MINLMVSLTGLWHHGNRFCGKIPSNIGDLVSLQSLNLNGNDLVGLIPTGTLSDSIENLESLNYIHFESNNLSGQIPTKWTHLRSLVLLDLSFDVVDCWIIVRRDRLSTRLAVYAGNSDEFQVRIEPDFDDEVIGLCNQVRRLHDRGGSEGKEMRSGCEIFCEILIAILLPPLGVCLCHGYCTVAQEFETEAKFRTRMNLLGNLSSGITVWYYRILKIDIGSD